MWALFKKFDEETSLVRNMVIEGMCSKIGGDGFRFWFDKWCALVLLQSRFPGHYMIFFAKGFCCYANGSLVEWVMVFGILFCVGNFL